MRNEQTAWAAWSINLHLLVGWSAISRVPSAAASQLVSLLGVVHLNVPRGEPDRKKGAAGAVLDGIRCMLLGANARRFREGDVAG